LVYGGKSFLSQHVESDSDKLLKRARGKPELTDPPVGGEGIPEGFPKRAKIICLSRKRLAKKDFSLM